MFAPHLLASSTQHTSLLPANNAGMKYQEAWAICHAPYPIVAAAAGGIAFGAPSVLGSDYYVTGFQVGDRWLASYQPF